MHFLPTADKRTSTLVLFCELTVLKNKKSSSIGPFLKLGPTCMFKVQSQPLGDVSPEAVLILHMSSPKPSHQMKHLEA